MRRNHIIVLLSSISSEIAIFGLNMSNLQGQDESRPQTHGSSNVSTIEMTHSFISLIIYDCNYFYLYLWYATPMHAEMRNARLEHVQ